MHVVNQFDCGGMENGVVSLINASSTRVRHAVVCIHGPGTFQSRLDRARVPVYLIRRDDLSRLQAIRNFIGAIGDFKPDVVHTRNLATMPYQGIAFLKKVKNRIHGEHGIGLEELDKKSRRYAILRRLYDSLVAEYSAVSPSIAAWLARDIGIRSSRIHLTPNGVDSDRFHPVERAARAQRPAIHRQMTFISVGRLVQIKDHATLIDAFTLVKERLPGATLLLVGDGPLRRQIQERILARGMCGAIQVLGERNDVPAQLRRSDVFVLPSLSEGMCNALLEAMSSGLPCIATDAAGMSDFLHAAGCGLIVTRGNPSKMAAAMMAYAESPGLMRSHGVRARAYVQSRHSITAMVTSYETLYLRTAVDADRILPDLPKGERRPTA
jgi:sugar transferase (PEP-CTERM/EpsH1 system associated)